MKVSWDDEIPNIWKVRKFHGSKPPTREHIMIIHDGTDTYNNHYNQIDHDLHQKIMITKSVGIMKFPTEWEKIHGSKPPTREHIMIINNGTDT